MIKIILILLTSVVFSNIAYSDDAMETVDYVDPVQFAGRWYQIARNPIIFEPRNCVCAQQTLTLQDDGVLGVYNSCNVRSPEGRLREISGEAINQDPNTNAKFKVDFGVGRKGDYWIIGLAADYSWAVISEPRRRALYILSKTPFLKNELYQEALATASKQISTEKLLTTSHVDCKYP